MNELPEGWLAVKLTGVCELNPAKPKSNQVSSDLPVTFVPMAAVDAEVGAITNPTIREFSTVAKGFTSFQENDVIMAKITPCMENGKAAIARGLSNGIGFGSTEFHVFRTSAAVLPEYVFRFIRQESFRKSAEANMTGSVGQKRVPASFLNEYNLPLPPLAEQRRIVAKLETLLGKVGTCQRRLAKIPLLLKRFRQAVLAAACSGKLTADWRSKNEVLTPSEETDLPLGWRKCELGKIIWVKAGEAFKKSEYSDSGAKLLQIANVSFGKIIWDQKNYLPLDYLRKHPELVLKEGDILLALNRPILDWRLKIARVSSSDLPAILYQRVGKFILKNCESIDAGYLYQFFQSFDFLLALNARLRGSDQPYINPPEMYDIELSLPPVSEQQEIVRRVEAFFKLADQLEARYQKAKAQVDKLQQSILAKAFRGELVPTEAELARQAGREYESAAALLARVRGEKAAAGEAPKVSRRRATAGKAQDR